MTMLVVILAVVAVLALLGLVHRWLWVRLVRDTTRAGGAARRAGTVLAFALPVLSLAAVVGGHAGAPFWLQRVVAWPGFLWLAVLLYLTLAMLPAEPVRHVWLRRLSRDTAGAAPEPVGAAGPGAPGSGAQPPSREGAVAGTAPRAAAPAAGTPAAPAGPEADPASGASEAAPAPGGPEADLAPAGPAAASASGVCEGASASGGPEAASAPGGPAAALAPAGPAAASASGVCEGASAPGGPEAARASGGPAAALAPAGPAADPAPGGPEAASGPEAPEGAPGGGLPRRVFVARVLGGAAVAAAGVTVGGGAYGVLRGPRVKRVRVPLARLPRAAHGFRIAVVSDVHLGPILGRAHTRRVVETVNRTQPDLIAVVGDLVDGSVHDLGPAAEPLRELRARHGSFFVTGNHEYFSGAQQWVDHVRELGLVPLENARRELPHFDLAGVNDVQGEKEGKGPDFQAALGDRDRSRTSVLLAHQPVVIHDAVRHGVDLQLSGHTHGGQLWPGNYVAELANPTVAGLERYGDTQLYVSRGAGAWGPPVRVGAPSDITVVELASYHT
ncbi:metallophosphoesterase [Streptomyces sp. NPDC048387]|uniref:metallophosphoesterase n=1 Tax=Streptomyces sp. NPDC048387 TaxID=3365542 RepID=UPI00371D05B0